MSSRRRACTIRASAFNRCHKLSVIRRMCPIASLPGDGAAPRVLQKLRSVRHVAFLRALDSVGCPSSSPDGVPMADNSMTGTFQINLPKDLLSEAKRASKPKNDQLRVEGWRTSWMSRLTELLVGKD